MSEKVQEKQFVTVFDCMDGRCQEPVCAWCKEHLGARFPDTITEPGMDHFLSNGADHSDLKRKAAISTEHHGARTAVIVGHCNCAGNPVSDDEHLEHVKLGCKQVASWGMFSQVVGLFVGGDSDESWTVTEVCRHV